MFIMTLHDGMVRENHVVEFAEGRLIVWRPSESGKEPPGHLWRWELEPQDGRTWRRTPTTGPTWPTRALVESSEPGGCTSERLAASLERLPLRPKPRTLLGGRFKCGRLRRAQRGS